jgi:hypothetical protein
MARVQATARKERHSREVARRLEQVKNGFGGLQPCIAGAAAAATKVNFGTAVSK